MKEVSDSDLKKVITDFLAMGHVENIISMFRKNPDYFTWTGELLQDERFAARLGLTIVFEEMTEEHLSSVEKAIPSLAKVLNHDSALFRGEALGILGIIGTPEARRLISTMREDGSPQVQEMVKMLLQEES